MHGGHSKTSCRYRGEDRRQPRTRPRQKVRPVELIAFVAVLFVVALLLPAAVHQLAPPNTARRAFGALRIAWSMLFVSAGVLRLVRWRMTGETRNGHLGAALLAFGVISAPASMLSPAMFTTEPALTLSPISRALSVIACVGLLVRALRAPTVDSALRPLRSAVAMTGAAWAVVVLFIVVGSHHPLDAPPRVWALVELALTLGWVCCSVAAFRDGIRAARPTTVWLAISLATMAAAEALRSLAFLAGGWPTFLATGLQLVVGAISVANAGADLSEVFSSEGNRVLSLTGALQETEELLDEEQRRREERLHDARSLIAALKGASLTLDRYDERLDAVTKSRLRSSMVSELSRLERVIDARAQEPVRAFRLDVALVPLFIAEQKNGIVINSHLGALSVQGRPLEFVTVMQNLLVNAARHAPGSPVTVRAVAGPEAVTVYVEDRGPGITTDHHEHVFDRGFRSRPTGAVGSGLGLFLARRLMREQGGEIRVEDRPEGGARFVLTLPTPRMAPQAFAPTPADASVGVPAPRPAGEFTSSRARPLQVGAT